MLNLDKRTKKYLKQMKRSLSDIDKEIEEGTFDLQQKTTFT